MDNLINSILLYVIYVIIISPVFLSLKFLLNKFSKIYTLKFLFHDSLIISSYVTGLLIIDEHFNWMIMKLCECKIDEFMHNIYYGTYIFLIYIFLVWYLFIKKSLFIKNSLEIRNISYITWELLIFTIWIIISLFLFRIAILLMSWV